MQETLETLIRPFQRDTREKPIPPSAGERSRSQRYIREFELPPQVEAGLTRVESELLELLVDAAKAIEPAYARQVGRGDRANLYPKSVAKRAINKAARGNPEILSPYTTVQRTKDGELVAVPTHELHREILEARRVPQLLKDAASKASRTKDFELYTYLRAKARSLENGDFETSEKLWLERESEPKIDIVIGLYDTYIDRFLGKKFAWEAWVGVLDEERTNKSQEFLANFLNWHEKETGMESPKVKMRIDNTVIQSGQAAEFGWTGNSLPCQREWREKYGSKFYVFWPAFQDKYAKETLPDFRSLIHPNKKMGVTDQMIETASLRKLIAHETSHSLGVAEDLETRLQNEAAWTKELYCDLLALKGYAYMARLNPEPMLDTREREIAVATYFSTGFRDFKNYQVNKSRREYHVASTSVFNYCLEKGGIGIIDGKINWTRDVFRNISDLFSVVDELQAQGTLKEALAFREQHFDSRPDSYNQLSESPVSGK